MSFREAFSPDFMSKLCPDLVRMTDTFESQCSGLNICMVGKVFIVLCLCCAFYYALLTENFIFHYKLNSFLKSN